MHKYIVLGRGKSYFVKKQNSDPNTNATTDRNVSSSIGPRYQYVDVGQGKKQTHTTLNYSVKYIISIVGREIKHPGNLLVVFPERLLHKLCKHVVTKEMISIFTMWFIEC
jgi:hypothetical protein